MQLAEKERFIQAELDALTDEYVAWNAAQGLKLGSADEHLFDDDLSADQRAWLQDFCDRWETSAPYWRAGMGVSSIRLDNLSRVKGQQ